MISATLFTLWAAAAPAKLPPAVAKEMSDAVVAVDKALGLESWPTHGAEPCVKRAGPENPTQDVSREDTRSCAVSVLAAGFPTLGKSYVVAVLMAPMGPTTVFALGIDEAAGWGAYSCDPGRKCAPTAISASTKWGKRLLDRQQKACASDSTLWFPAGHRACPASDKAPSKP
jgi:hypothetical protein